MEDKKEETRILIALGIIAVFSTAILYFKESFQSSNEIIAKTTYVYVLSLVVCWTLFILIKSINLKYSEPGKDGILGINYPEKWAHTLYDWGISILFYTPFVVILNFISKIADKVSVKYQISNLLVHVYFYLLFIITLTIILISIDNKGKNGRNKKN